MNKLAIICLLTVVGIGCGNNAQQVQNTSNSAAEPQRSEKLQTTTAHTTENQPQKVANSNSASGSSSKWSQGGEAIDTAKFDGVIAAAEKTVKSKPTDAEAKKTLAQAYFDRGFALTEARQYASALGDYRRALKNDPGHEDSKKWIDQIISIYSMLKKEYPKEGEEPPALPFKKA
jgi:tetratricopeptide (TPR) repeat protein